MVSDEESVQGLLLLPAEHHVAMLERPVTTRMSFTQFTATLSGRISCLGEKYCTSLEDSCDLGDAYCLWINV